MRIHEMKRRRLAAAGCCGLHRHFEFDNVQQSTLKEKFLEDEHRVVGSVFAHAQV